MEKIILDEQNRKRIQKFIKQELGFYGYEQDIEILERTGELTEELARKVFTEIMNDAHRTRTMLEPEEDSEFKEEIEEAFVRYDKIPKPEHLEEYGFYDGVYNNMELDDIYSNMQIAFELRELDNKYYECRDLRNIAETVIKSIDGIEKYQIELQPGAKEELQRIQEELRTLLSAEKTDIQGIQEKIELYNGHATNIWNDYLTDINYETTPIYSELIVDEFEIEGVYYISYGEHELAKDYERAKKVADERGLPLIERDISKYRAEHGLEPMTDKAKMNLCRNVLWKCCSGDRELEQAYSKFAKGFIKYNFKDFYEKFMKLKGNPEFSKEDILRAFADVTRGDIDFGKISQNIDEMYLSEEQKEIIQAMQEYGLTDIQDVQTLQQRLEKCISDGIFYSADQQNPEKMKRFETIKKAIPQYEELKIVYLQLRQAGLEDELYKGIDLNNINYSELLEKATKILEEKAKIDDVFVK